MPGVLKIKTDAGDRMGDKKDAPRRSQAWFGRQDRDGFIYRSWMKNRGIPHV